MGGDLPADLDLHVVDAVDGPDALVQRGGERGAMPGGREAQGDADLDPPSFDIQRLDGFRALEIGLHVRVMVRGDGLFDPVALWLGHLRELRRNVGNRAGILHESPGEGASFAPAPLSGVLPELQGGGARAPGFAAGVVVMKMSSSEYEMSAHAESGRER